MVMGVTAYLVLIGPLAPARLALFPVVVLNGDAGPPIIAQSAAAFVSFSPGFVAVVIAAGFLACSLSSREFRRAPNQIFWGVMAGLAVVSGWWGTAHLAATGFDGTPVESHTFTAPLGESILYVMTSTGGGVGFSVGSVAGVMIGAFWGSVALGHFRWEACDDPRELGRQIFGAVLMGVGGVVAMGCSMGQGLTAFSTLAWSAPVVVVSIVIGAALGLRHLIEGVAFPRRLSIGRIGAKDAALRRQAR